MANGGIIGPENKTSFGKNKVTSQTSTGDLTTQPGTRFVDTLVVAGGGGGGGSVFVGVRIGGIVVSPKGGGCGCGRSACRDLFGQC